MVLPSGEVTFLFSDIEGSTGLWERDPDAMRLALRDHDDLARRVVGAARGTVFKHTGDGFAAVFADPSAALEAACDFEAGLSAIRNAMLRARMGVHSGQGVPRDGDYFGPDVNRAARVMDAANGGQIVVSGTTRLAAGDRLPDTTSLVDAGQHRLKDLAAPVHLFRLVRPVEVDRRPLRTLDVVANNLPRQASSFLGREQDMTEVVAVVTEHPLTTLTGIGGVGKTRLSLQVSAQVLHEFPDGVWFVELAPLSDPGLIASEIAAAMELPPDPYRSSLEQLLDTVARQRVLFIVDNCEHIVHGTAKLIDQLLRSTQHVHVLATSREPLRVDGEQVWAVPVLETGETGTAAALFEDRARLIQPDFAIESSNSRSVAELCKRLDGIPLAIELAAARLNILTVEQIIEHLDDRFQLLTAGSRTAQRRQQTLEGMMDWSYELLTDEQQALLRRLSVFVEGFDLEGAIAVASGEQLPRFVVIDQLGHLVAASLINKVATPEPRYRMLETVRQYGHTKLTDAGETPEAQRRHAQRYASVAQQAHESLTWDRWDESVAELIDRELPNLRSAIEWAYESDNVDTGLQIAFAIREFLWNTLHLEESYRLIVTGLEHVRVFDTMTRMRALFRVMDYAMRILDEDLATRYLALVNQLLQEVADPELRASLLETRAIPHSGNDPVNTDQALAEAMELYRAAGNRRWTAVLINRFDIMSETGDGALADELLLQLDRAEGAGLTSEVGALCRVDAEVTRGRPEAALAILNNLQLEGDLNRLNAHLSYAKVYLELSKPEAADECFSSALMAIEDSPPEFRAELGHDEASIALALADHGRAVRALEPLRTAGRSAYGLVWRAKAALLTARCAVARHDFSRAAVLIGYWDRWARERGFGLTPSAAARYEAARRETRDALGGAAFDQLAGKGATADYEGLPFYDT